MEARGTAEVDPSLRSRGVGRDLEGALEVILPREHLEERHLLPDMSSVMVFLLCKACTSPIERIGWATCSLQEDWLWVLLLRAHGILSSFAENNLMSSGIEVQLL